MRVCETRIPANCSEIELEEFRKLAISAGKIAADGLPELIVRARLLAFLRDGGRLIGVAGLKRPRESYRKRVTERSGVPLPLATYPFELGWVSVEPTMVGGKSWLLCDPLIAQTPGEGVFATTGVDNGRMQTTLVKLGFIRKDETWTSSETDETLCLFILGR
ncbi:hypothetical protein [Variovorax paradoxus]|uniref:hypothetical protein n=1 Tax=Variovorax paradoxus TaxID=34073 RepID=UPI002789D059|nr:hypothetical protein [Variovorax paradoxus]MDP9932590.1 hypothetical protein [Variovorax paradoxus]